jgi:hypothetical protein
MKTIKTILAVLGVGAVLAAAGPAAAGVGISVGFSQGQVGGQVVITRLAPVMVAQAPVYVAAPQPAVVALANAYAYGPFSGYAGQARYFQFYVPAGQTYMTIVTEGSLGDSNLLASQGYWPTPDNATLASFNDGTSERIEVLYPTPGVWNIVVYGNSAFSNVSILASYWQQDTYLPTYTTYDAYPAGRTNVLVRIAWGNAGCERPFGGWIPFIRNRIAQPRVTLQHRFDNPRFEERRPVVVAPRIEDRRPVAVAPRMEEHRPVAVAPRIEDRRPMVVAPRVEERRPVAVAPRVEDRRPVAVAPRVEDRRPVAVAPRMEEHRPEQRMTVTPRADSAPRANAAPRPMSAPQTTLRQGSGADRRRDAATPSAQGRVERRR